MGIVILVHSTLSNTIWLFFLILGLWGLFRGIRRQGIDGSYLGAMVIGEILYAVQGVLGLILWMGGFLPGVDRPTMHILYGAFAGRVHALCLLRLAQRGRFQPGTVGVGFRHPVFVRHRPARSGNGRINRCKLSEFRRKPSIKSMQIIKGSSGFRGVDAVKRDA